MARPYGQRPSHVLSYYWWRSQSGKYQIPSWGIRFYCDHVVFFTSNGDIRRRWCPPPGQYSIHVSSQVKLDIKALQAVKDVNAAQDALIDIFERIENFFKRLETYTEVKPTEAMTDIIIKIMVEVLNFFAIATKEIKQGRTSELPDVPICMPLYRFH